MAAYALTSTAAHSTNNSCYDVFINHRGPDVKKTFASHLYRRLTSSGYTAFLDQEELQVGRNSDPQIKEAIRTASVHVAIFSPTYAQSSWCLDELVLMMQSGAPIIPVFHRVEPEDVQRTRGKGVYAQALRSLERKRNHDSQPLHDSNTIEKWRTALSHVARMSGLELKAFNYDEGVLVDKVVESVQKLRPPSYVAKHLIGVDEIWGLPRVRRRGRDRNAEDRWREPQKVRRILKHLCAGVPATPVKALPKSLQTRFVGVSRPWMIPLQQVATMFVDRMRAAASRGGDPWPFRGPYD